MDSTRAKKRSSISRAMPFNPLKKFGCLPSEGTHDAGAVHPPRRAYAWRGFALARLKVREHRGQQEHANLASAGPRVVEFDAECVGLVGVLVQHERDSSQGYSHSCAFVFRVEERTREATLTDLETGWLTKVPPYAWYRIHLSSNFNTYNKVIVLDAEFNRTGSEIRSVREEMGREGSGRNQRNARHPESAPSSSRSQTAKEAALSRGRGQVGTRKALEKLQTSPTEERRHAAEEWRMMIRRQGNVADEGVTQRKTWVSMGCGEAGGAQAHQAGTTSGRWNGSVQRARLINPQAGIRVEGVSAAANPRASTNEPPPHGDDTGREDARQGGSETQGACASPHTTSTTNAERCCSTSASRLRRRQMCGGKP
ncbi:hypothetical protein C8R47DRAFT_1204579 [Mycena vitilis]|nr:hypothetical protein C8R47DRAFT_1204579 [Mycena vitilis]